MEWRRSSLPIAGEPVLAHVLRECAQSGIEHALVVVSPEKQSVVDVREERGGGGGNARADRHRGADAAAGGSPMRYAWAASFANGEPVAVALPDNLFVDTPQPAVAQVIETYGREHVNVVGLTEITADIAASRGPTPIYPGTRAGDEFLIESDPEQGRARKHLRSGQCALRDDWRRAVRVHAGGVRNHR